MRHALALARRLSFAAAAVVLAQSVFWTPGAPIAFLAIVAALFATAVWRPAWGLILLAGLAPFGRMLAVVWLGGHPIRGTEALALAVLAGIAVRHAARPLSPPAVPPRVAGPWILFAAAAVASAVVLCRVTQFHHAYPGEYLAALVEAAATAYHGVQGDPRPWANPLGLEHVGAAALVVEGVALMLVAGRLCQADPRLALRLAAASVIAGVLAATLSIDAVIDTALSTGTDLFAFVTAHRTAIHVTKVNTAGSYFVLVTALGVGLAAADGRRRFVWLAAAAVSAVGLWLTASLAAILPGIAVAIVAALARIDHVKDRGRWRQVAVVVVVTVLIAIALGRLATRPKAFTSLQLRWAITEVSLTTFAERPVFGVGLGTYTLRSQPHITDAVRAGYGDQRIEAHNYLLQIAAELGLVGLGLFLWAIAATVVWAMAVPESQRRPLARGAAGGLAAFLTSALAGQPMLADSVAIPVWLVLGVLIGSAPPRRAPQRARWVMLGVVALLLTLPLRMRTAVNEVDVSLAAHGTTTEQDAGGRYVHVISRPARLFVAGTDRAVEIEAGSRLAPPSGDLFVRVAGDGLVATPLRLPAGASRAACITIDSAALRLSGPRAIDIAVVDGMGAPAIPGSAWVLVTGLARPCRP